MGFAGRFSSDVEHLFSGCVIAEQRLVNLVQLNPQCAAVAMFKPEMKPGAVPLINNQQFLADYLLEIAAAAQ